ncbi:hypothetical protein PybrP1_002635 [[Pythium] brassicae (nom. inval.)]|nr:hypothetical protein PybrP1_002635 [[Pythium] brassicae (nom. inval.)]
MSLHLPQHKWGTRGVDAYEKLECIGAGTYGQVYMAKNKATDEVVAIKKIRSLNEVQGLPVTTIREIKVLKCLSHRNILELKEVVVSVENDDDDAEFTDKEEALDYCQGSIYLVLEYVEHDLTGLIDRQHPFSDVEIKSIMQQLLEVMRHMHSLDIIHRDIKCSNLLMTKTHLLKVADFGLARSIRGDQLKFVPEKPKTSQLKSYLLRETSARKRILPKGALELLMALLVMDPEQRLTAADCLNSTYFQSRPYAPSDPESLPHILNLPPSHEYQTKKLRREQAKQILNGANKSSAAGGGRAGSPSSRQGSVEEVAPREPAGMMKQEKKRGEAAGAATGESTAKKRRDQ